MITTNWEIISLHFAPEKDGLTKVVEKVFWKFQVTDGEHYGDCFELITLSAPSPDNYVNYEDLSDEIVVGWIFANRDYNSLYNLAMSRMEENKKPVLIESRPPWNNQEILNGDEEYLVVFDDQPNDLNKVWGPLRWDAVNLNKGLQIKGFEFVRVPENLHVYGKKFIPVDKPLVLSDRVKIYRVEPRTSVDYNPLTQNISENFTWVLDSGRAVATYIITDKTIDEVKHHIKKIVNIKTGDEIHTPLDFELNGKLHRTFKDPQTYFMTLNVANSLTDQETIKWKFVGGDWINATKVDLLFTANLIRTETQKIFDAEHAIHQQINSCTNINQLKQLFDDLELGS